MLMAASYTLVSREIVRFFRQKNRVAGTIGTPLVFWFLIGSGFGEMEFGGALNYKQYFFPGTILLVTLFTAIFSTISIIEDRREGFLQAVLIAPIARSELVLGKLLGGTALALIQALLFFLITPFLGIRLTIADFFYLVGILFFISFGLTGLGFIMAWRLDSTQGFHALMNLFLMPLWLLSGALFPIEGVPAWLHVVMMVNPLTYAVSGLHHGFFQQVHHDVFLLSSRSFCLAICVLFSALMFACAVRTAKRI